MADTDSTAAPEVPMPVELTGAEAAREASLDLMTKSLPPEQAEVLKKSRAEKKAKPTKPTAVAETPAPEPDKEVIDFGQDAPASDQPTETPEPETPTDELSDDELAKLDEKARRRYLDASKENAKIRKRAQEAEGKAAEEATARTAAETKAAEIAAKLEELQTRGPALVGNQFGKFEDGKQVAAWGRNAQEALALLTAHDRAVTAGRADADDTVLHALPTGQEIELRLADRQAYEARVMDAQAWFATDHDLSQNRETAKKIEERYAKTQGYTDARAKYAADTTLHTKLPELMAKAALYDTLMARRAVITFPDTVGATTTAPSAPAARTPDKAQTPTKTKAAPPSESPGRAPRMASAMSGDDAGARKSQLMELARTAPTYELQQKYAKEAAMIPSPNRTTSATRRGAAA